MKDYVIANLWSDGENRSKTLVNEAEKWIDELYRTQQVLGSVNIPKQIIFRLDVRVDWRDLEGLQFPIAHDILDAVQMRFGSAEVFLLFSARFEIKLLRISSNSFEFLGHEITTSIMDDELSKLALSSELQALYHNYGQYYYRLPSGEVCDFFFRVGNIQISKLNLDVILFWCIPYLKGISTIICDTWSISTLCAHLASSIQKYSRGDQVEWDYLAGYMVDDCLMQEQLTNSIEKATAEQKNILFLLSATASGRSQKSIAEIIKTSEIEPTRIKVLTMYALANSFSDDNVLCDLSERLSISKNLKGVIDTAELSTEVPVFDIDKKTYFPQYFNVKEHEFKVGKIVDSHTGMNREFYERYAGHQIFSVCRNGFSNKTLGDPRHHAFHIDAERMFGLPQFKERLKRELCFDQGVYTHIVYIKDEANRCLIELVKTIVRNQPKLIEVDCFSEMTSNQDLIGAYGTKNSSLLFVDSLVISGGSRLERFQRSLRKVISNGFVLEEGSKIRMTYLVGLARPDSKLKLDRWIRFIPQSGPGSGSWLRLSIVEHVILPNWHSNKCPWCSEKNVLKSVLNAYEDSMQREEIQYIDQRLQKLDNIRKGLREDLFFKRYKSDKFEFDIGSFFLNLTNITVAAERVTDADLVCAAASAFQTWRDETSQLTPAKYVVPAKVTFESTMYNEPRLRAAIWRSLLPTEIALLNSNDIDEARTLLEYVFNSSEAPGIDERRNEFVLGFEAAFLFGSNLIRILSKDRFESIDWKFLQWISRETR